MSLLFLFILCAFAAYLYFCVRKKQSYWKERGIKYVQPLFLFGNVPLIRSKSIVEVMQDAYNTFPKERYVGVYQFIQPTLLIRDPKLIKVVMVQEFEHFMNHPPPTHADSDPLWSGNLFSARDRKWRQLRSTLSPSFTGSKMKIMFSLIDECAQQFVEFFNKGQSEVIELEMKDVFTRYTNDAIATTAFGLKCDSFNDRNNDFYMMGKRAIEYGIVGTVRFLAHLVCPTLSRLLKITIVSKSSANYFRQVIEDTVKTRKEKHIVRPDLIHLLLDAQKGNHREEELVDEGFSIVSETGAHSFKKPITLQDIISQAFIFFIASYESVSTVLCFLFYELAVSPDVQERLRKEIQAVPDKITYESLVHLKYLDMVISETLRKWPSGIMTDRQVSKAFTIAPERPGEKPVHLSEGMICTVPIYALHRDPKYYPEPEKFDPERFNDQNKHKINPSMYIPFGAGPRSCVGSRLALLKIKLIAYRVLKNFEIVTVSKTRIPMVLDNYQVTLTAKGGMWLGFKKLK